MSFPAIHSTLSPTALSQLIRDQYQLSGETTCKLFRAAMNHLYIVSDKERMFVFRVYTHHWRTKTEIEEELRLLLHLKESSGHAAWPIADHSNNYIQEIDAPEGMRYGVLFSYAKGIKTAKFTPQASFEIGQALAKVHQSTENFVLNRISYNTHSLLADALISAKSFYGNTSDEIKFLEQLSSLLGKQFDRADAGPLRYGSVHLDVWFDNMHINDEKEITFFDFDFCGNGYLCLDVSYFLYQLFTTHPDEKEYRLKAEHFLNGYQSVNPLSIEEKLFLPYACMAVITYYIGVQCDRFDYWTNIFLNHDHLKRMTGNLQRWMACHKIETE